MPTVDTYPNINVLCSIHYKRFSEVNVESSVFVNAFCLILLVIHVMCKLYPKKKYKLAYQLTWTSLERTYQHLHEDETMVTNSYRNQIDFIFTKLLQKGLVQNSRSYCGTPISIDHKLVKAELKLKTAKIKRKSTPIDVELWSRTVCEGSK